MRRSILPLAFVLALGAAACASDQDPGLEGPTGSSQTTAPGTPRTLGPCPAGGPDSTTPAGGCLDEDGLVQRAG